jgi:hypothetical protein
MVIKLRTAMLVLKVCNFLPQLLVKSETRILLPIVKTNKELRVTM